MNWNSLFKKNESLSTIEVREHLASKPTNSFQLLDVRQAKEYQEQHIPGATLIPLNELPDRLTELDHKKKTIIYCRSGARSNAACQLLRDQDFTEVLNMSGGILQWQGHTAQGDYNQGLDLFLDGDFDSALDMTYQMEYGLKVLYLLMSDQASSPQIQNLLREMALLEDGHMAKINARYGINKDKPTGQAGIDPTVLEGGIDFSDLKDTYGAHLDNAESILHFALMLETQAYDLYLRLARKSSDSSLATFFQQMAKEEQKHLDKLARELDNLLIE